MTSVTIAQINTALHDTLSQVNVPLFPQNFDELTESINQYPTIQFYFVSKENSLASQTSKGTFGNQTQNSLRQTTVTFHVDLHVTPRNFINQIYAQTYPLIDEIDLIFEDQINTPLFGLDGVKAFRYRCEQATFNYNDSVTNGVRWFVEIDLF